VASDLDATIKTRPVGREKQSKKIPSHLADYICCMTCSKNPSSSPQQPQMISSTKPNLVANYFSCDNFPNAHNGYLAAITKVIEPRYF